MLIPQVEAEHDDHCVDEVDGKRTDERHGEERLGAGPSVRRER